jgi:DNA-binding CsgD family transcriptional regulator
MKYSSTVFLVVHGALLRRGIANTLERLGVDARRGACLDDYLTLANALGRAPDLLIVDVAIARSLVDSMDESLRPRRVVVIGKGDTPLEPGHWAPITTCSWLPVDATAAQVERTFVTVLECAVDLRVERPSSCGQCVLAATLLPPKVPLSAREQEILIMVSRGDGPQKIAEAFGISIKTVETHLARIKRKLGAQSSAELLIAAVAWRLGWLRLCALAKDAESSSFLAPTGLVAKRQSRPVGDA